ncbi:MAG: hypothetical protein AB4040_04265 [Synechococcus sp.]
MQPSLDLELSVLTDMATAKTSIRYESNVSDPLPFGLTSVSN